MVWHHFIMQHLNTAAGFPCHLCSCLTECLSHISAQNRGLNLRRSLLCFTGAFSIYIVSICTSSPFSFAFVPVQRTLVRCNAAKLIIFSQFKQQIGNNFALCAYQKTTKTILMAFRPCWAYRRWRLVLTDGPPPYTNYLPC